MNIIQHQLKLKQQFPFLRIALSMYGKRLLPQSLFLTSDLICGPPPTKSTTTQRTTTRQPEPLPTIVTSVIGSQPDVLPGQRKNPPRRRNGLVEQNSNAFLNKGRRLIPQGSKKSSQYDSNKSPNPPVKKFNSQSGEP